MQPQISSITKGPRQSNMELLRIVAMLMVLTIHVDFWTLGYPSISDFTLRPGITWGRTFIEAAGIASVNIFVMISGWFGIRASVKGFSNFIWQCFFALAFTYLLAVFTGRTSLAPGAMARDAFSLALLCPTEWFIPSYMFLYVLSPIINSFLEKASKRQLERVLIAFYLLQLAYGWAGSVSFLQQGYSPLSFVGLYMLAYYLRHYAAKWHKYGGGDLYCRRIRNYCLLLCHKSPFAPPSQHLIQSALLSQSDGDSHGGRTRHVVLAA